MQFLDDSLFPENQQPLVIQVAPYGPEWIPADSSDIPVTMDEQVQKAVDCYNAAQRYCTSTAARPTARAPSRSMFNELLARLRDAVPDMILQVGGSISIRARERQPRGPMAQRRHAAHARGATPKPDQVTIVINDQAQTTSASLLTATMSEYVLASPAYSAGLPRDDRFPRAPASSQEHLRRLQAEWHPAARSCSATWGSSSPSSA